MAKLAGDLLMDPSQFVKYIADHPGLKPNVTFEAYGFRETSPQGASATFPRGQAFIFPDYFAFLTTRHFRGGAQIFEESGEMLWQWFATFTKGVLKAHKYSGNPALIAVDIGKALGHRDYQEPKIIQKALTNQGSFFFPLSDLAGVDAGGAGRHHKDFRDASRAPYFRLITPDETYLVQNAMRVVPTPASFVRAFREHRNWQPRALELLQAAAARNTATR